MGKFRAAFEDATGTITRLSGELEYLPDPAATPGDVLTVQANGSVAAAPGGGSATVSYFEFAHGLAGLTNGVAFYTPTVGDIVLNAWFSVLEAWDGINPAIADFGTFTNAAASGFFATVSQGGVGLDVTAADLDLLAYSTYYGAGALIGANGTLPSAVSVGIAANVLGNVYGKNRQAPFQITTADPLKVVVSENGAIGGSDPASATGLARLYLQIATPTPL